MAADNRGHRESGRCDVEQVAAARADVPCSISDSRF